MGKKKFIDKKKSATFQLLARDSTDPNFGEAQGSDRIFVRVGNNPVSGDNLFDGDQDNVLDDSDHNSRFADAPKDDDDRVLGSSTRPQSAIDGDVSKSHPLPDHVRREILELGFPDDGYNYLIHLREIKNTGGGSAFYHNPKAKIDQLPHDVKADDASRLQIPKVNVEPNTKSIYRVASKTVGVRIQKVVDPEVAALLDESDLSRFGSDVDDLEEDFVVQANQLGEENIALDNRLNIVEESVLSKNDVRKSDTYGHAPSADAFGSHNGDTNHLAKAGVDYTCEKPRVYHLLDEQFDLLEHQEYGTDDEDESLAEKLKQALNDDAMDDIELDEKYKVPADLLQSKGSLKCKELVDSTADVIRRCMEYAEKYELDEDKDVVVVEESTDESEAWDCETIVSTYSTLDNHPGKIVAPELIRKRKLAETVSGALNSSNHIISLRGKEKLPLDFLPSSRKPAAEKVKGVSTVRTEQYKRKQHGQESKEEKKEWKDAVKEEQGEAWLVKKEMKGLYRSETQRAQKVAAISGPSSIHLI
ncbi:protein LTV1-like [Quillaja saponaria]|uniref:Protein LTV1-like n=1 Tax=Quillaja saponaria TaxID=32244 RepID=A0AAD7LYW1_QUISA|nr:protein LTV1-like [Quillaja saponaria]